MKLRRARTIVVSMTLAGFAAAAAVLAFVSLPALRATARLSDEIAREHAELEAQYVSRRNLLANGEKAAELRAGLAPLSAQFLPKGRELDFITAVEAVAERRGVQQRIQLSAPESPPAPELTVGFDISLDGETRAVLAALSDLERLPTLLVTEMLSLRPAPRADGGSDLSLNLRGALATPPPGL